MACWLMCAAVVAFAPDRSQSGMAVLPQQQVSDDDDSDCCEELEERLEVVERIMSWQQSSGNASLYWHLSVPGGPAWQCITNGLDTSYVTNWELVEEDCP